MAQLIQKRISALDPQDDVVANALVDELIISTEKSSKWAMAVDYTEADIVSNDSVQEVDQGTKRIPVSRVGLLTETRTVPQSMLPHQMDEILNGTMHFDTNTGKWTFTTTEGGTTRVYVCPGPPAAGELRPDISTIYRDVNDADGDGNPIYTQYRYVPDDNASVGTENETGSFVPIPSDLVMVNGDGTVVSDNSGSYTRQVDIAIGEPASESSTHNSILISGGKLRHSTSGVTAGTYPTPPQSGQLAFGGTFAVDAFTVNSTGHITAVTPYSLTVPSTAASTSAEGLVKIGGLADINNIGQNKSAGTTTPSPYVKVAAADHVHAASHLILTNINDSSFQNGQLEYTGAGANQTYSFRNILKATLPSNGPTAPGQLLVSTGNTAETRQAIWCNPDDVFEAEYAIANVGSGYECGTTASAVTLNTTTARAGGHLEVTQNAFNGLKSGKLYVVCFNFGFSHANAGVYIEDVTVTVQLSNGTNWTTAVEWTYQIDGSVTGVANYINGSLLVPVGNGQTTARIMLRSGGTQWDVSTDSSIQIAEVK